MKQEAYRGVEAWKATKADGGQEGQWRPLDGKRHKEFSGFESSAITNYSGTDIVRWRRDKLLCPKSRE